MNKANKMLDDINYKKTDMKDIIEFKEVSKRDIRKVIEKTYLKIDAREIFCSRNGY